MATAWYAAPRSTFMPTRHPHTFTDQWLAIHVRAGREQLAARHLHVRGYEVFLPRYTEHRRWSDRTKRIERALFSGYLFSRTTGEFLDKIVTAPGVIGIVGDGRKPLPVPPEDIQAIHRIVESGVLVEPWRFVQAGQRVRIDAGPLRGIEGIILTIKNGCRLIVSVPLLQRSVAVEMAADWISVPEAAFLRCASA